jgi:hypothetical protein
LVHVFLTGRAGNVGAGELRLEKIMNKVIALAAIAFVLSAGAVTIIINAQPVMAGFCDNPTANC